MDYKVDFCSKAKRAVVAGYGSFPFSSGYALNTGAIGNTLFCNVSDIQKDLVDLVVQIYVADRLCKRPRSNFSSVRKGWARNIEVSLCVLQPEYWSQKERNREFEDLLHYLTGDNWHIQYTRGAKFAGEQGVLSLGELNPDVKICLFSGGLDSLAGLANVVEACPGNEIVLVSACTGSRSSSSLKQLVRNRLPRRIGQNWVRVSYRLQEGERRRKEEVTQRARCLPPMVAASVLAAGFGASEVLVMENGIGAINLPYSAGQLGQDSTRSTHPYFLLRLSRWLSSHLGQDVALKLRFPFSTKGQICGSLRSPLWRPAIAASFSCDRFGRGGATSSHCGLCTSCLLRRQSLHAAGLIEDDRADYGSDVLSRFSARGLGDRKLVHFRSMALQAYRLSDALAAPSPWSVLSQDFPELFSAELGLEATLGLPSSVVQARLVELYRVYTKEWRSFERATGVAEGLWVRNAQVVA